MSKADDLLNDIANAEQDLIRNATHDGLTEWLLPSAKGAGRWTISIQTRPNPHRPFVIHQVTRGVGREKYWAALHVLECVVLAAQSVRDIELKARGVEVNPK